ncbi:MAG: hypothetical protein NVSMB31_15120 [Vulcanimicrobiaceae bacterium]
MSRENSRRGLIVAVALSILLHLSGVRFVHWGVPSPQDVPENTIVSKIVVQHRTVRTPPPQTPRPIPAVPKVVATVNPIHAPHVQNTRGAGVQPIVKVVAVPTPTPTPRPSPLATPTASPAGGCLNPNAAAAVKSLAIAPEMPVAVRETAKGATVRVHLRLSETGQVLEAAVLSSSGNDAEDQLALIQARNSTYTPAYALCKGIASTYDFSAKFIIP